MHYLTREELEQLDDAALVEALQQLADDTGAELTANEETDLIQLYLDTVPKEEEGRVWITALDTLQFKDDGQRRQVLKGHRARVSKAVADDLKRHGLVQ
ncbi:MAG: hypothetical protein OIF57_10510 [Marinobacterium sp.]|nr:hypothetical protein [Marinobacterium sp.]